MYIVQKRRRYYLEHRLPPKAAEALGKSKLSKSLGTDSRREAERRALPIEMDWRRQIAEALSDDPDQLAREYGHWRHSILNAQTEDDRHIATDLLTDELQDRVHRAAEREGIAYNDQHGITSLPEYSETFDAYQYATGQKIRLTEHLEAYLSRLEVKPKTIDQRRTAINKLAQRLPYVDSVTGADVQQYIDDRIDNGITIATIRRELSGWRDYWQYLASLGVVAQDVQPFAKPYLPRKSKNAPKARDSFTPAEAVSLLRAAIAKDDAPLADLIRLGMFTGARLEELCKLGVDDVDDGFLVIRDAKTVAGIRDVPIHSRLQRTVHRLDKESADGYLLSGLSVTQYGDRSGAIGKRFGKLKRKHGFGSRHVFHSLRGTVSTLLENAGVPETRAADIVGHEKSGMTYGHYSSGNWRTTMADAIERIDYPDLSDDDMR